MIKRTEERLLPFSFFCWIAGWDEMADMECPNGRTEKHGKSRKQRSLASSLLLLQGFYKMVYELGFVLCNAVELVHRILTDAYC